ncbi:MAG TPA: nuclear transport factor 2 family protein [Holophagaceae bacterium]|nr:nuclear transport factor 2 family protein [Holophagaceae bacterium]
MSPLQELLDRQAIVDAVVRWATALDDKDWEAARACLGDEIEADYGDLRGSAAHMGAEAFVALRREALGPLRTHHLSTNHLVELAGDEATCRSAFLIHRLDPALPEPNTYDSLGHYEHGLRRIDGAWRIVRARQTVAWSRGNAAIHAGARPAEGAGGQPAAR